MNNKIIKLSNYQIIKLFVLLSFIAFFSSCKTLKTDAPPHDTDVPVIVQKSSTVNIPIILDVKDMETKINKDLNGLLYEDNSLDNNNHDNLMIKAWKKENFTLTLNGNELSYTLPLKLWIKAGFKIEKFGFSVSDYREFNAEIALKYKTAFTINKDWTLSTKTTSDGYNWLSAPTLNIAGKSIPITFIADIILKASQNIINRKIDDTINKNRSLKKSMEDVLKLLQKPVKVNDEYNVYLRIIPQEILAMPITGANNKMNIAVGIKSVNELIIGKEPLPLSSVPLPDLHIVNKLDPMFSINVNTDIPFTKINELAKQELTGKIFTQGKKKVEIKEINIYGSKDKFIVELAVEGSIKGNVFLKGKPVYNVVNKTVEIKELDFDISTRNALLKTANWLMHGSFIRMIEPKLVYSISNNLTDSQSMIQKYLDNNKSLKGMTLNGKLTSLDIDNIYVTDESLRVIVNMQGTLSIMVDGLSGL